MEKETLGFWHHFELFFLHDDHARWKAIGWIIGLVGLCGSFDLALSDASVEEAVILMGSLTLILSISWISWYCSFGRSHSPNMGQSLTSRRTWAVQAGILIAFILSLRLPSAEARSAERKLQRASDDPSDPENARVAHQTLAAARSGFVRLESSVVKQTGVKFIQTAAQNPDAWSTVTEYLSYHSFLNLSSVPTGQLRALKRPFQTQYEAKNVLNFPTAVYWTGSSEFPEVAQFRRISDPDLNVGKSGPAFLLIEGADVLLDDMHIKRVILKNSHIIYKGGPVSLETVYFVNCTFDIVRESNGLRLAEEVLSAPATTAQLG